MMKTIPLRRTIRHLAQRLRMEGDTFMKFLLALRSLWQSQTLNYTCRSQFRPYFYGYPQGHKTVRI